MPTDGTTTRDRVAWLARRAAWGLAPGRLDELTELGVEAVLDLLTDPDAHGVDAEPSPWEGFTYDPEGQLRDQGVDALEAWLDHMVATDRPFENAMAWFWHDHFAVSIAAVTHLPSMQRHLELLRTTALGDFRTMIRAVTTDPAMLVFLDGRTSSGESPNENYGRELLELYTLGVGNFTEDDVRAAATALTGWVVGERTGWEPRFLPRRHDDTPQTLLGVDGIHDVDGVVDTAVAHPAAAPFVAAKLVAELLGGVDPAVVERLAGTFRDSGMEIRPLARAVLEAGAAGQAAPQVTAPVPWTVAALKATGARLPTRAVVGLLRQMGQVPANPPNVGGYPGSSTWLAASATAGRFTMASAIAESTPADAPVRIAAAEGDLDTLADLLLRPQGFGPATRAALADVPASASRTPGAGVLAVALASPDLLVR